MDPSPLTPSTVRCGATVLETSSRTITLGEPLDAQRTLTATPVYTKRRESTLPAFSYIYSRRRDIRRGRRGCRTLWFGESARGATENKLVPIGPRTSLENSLSSLGERRTHELPLRSVPLSIVVCTAARPATCNNPSKIPTVLSKSSSAKRGLDASHEGRRAGGGGFVASGGFLAHAP